MILKGVKRLKHFIETTYFPKYYKSKFFRTIEQLNWENIKNENIENELLLLNFIYPKNGYFVDIGANLGQYVYKASRLTKESMIVAFEPNPFLAKRLKKLFPEAIIQKLALSHKPGVTQFKIPLFKDKLMHTRGTLKIEHNEIDETGYKLIEVKIDTLDQLIPHFKERVSFVKIDVEGAEFDVISGAENFINKFKPNIMIEIEQRHHATPILDFISNFNTRHQYTCYYFDTVDQKLKEVTNSFNVNVLQSMENHGKNRRYINNFIFTPNQGEFHLDIDSINRQIHKA